MENARHLAERAGPIKGCVGIPPEGEDAPTAGQIDSGAVHVGVRGLGWVRLRTSQISSRHKAKGVWRHTDTFIIVVFSMVCYPYSNCHALAPLPINVYSIKNHLISNWVNLQEEAFRKSVNYKNNPIKQSFRYSQYWIMYFQSSYQGHNWACDLKRDFTLIYR